MLKLFIKKFCDKKHPFSFLDGKFEDMKRNYKRPPKKESLLLYREVVKISKRFYWRHKNGKEWSEILLNSARKEFEENRDLVDSAEIGKKIVIAKQALIEIEEKVNKTHFEMNKFFTETRNI
jgi:hypothetical protein